MKKVIFFVALFFLTSLIELNAQNFSSTVSYQLGRSGEYYGLSLSKWIKTWNNEKVILRGTASYILGNHWGEKSSTKNFNSVELGIDSRNTMVTGKDFFNIINISYLFTNSEIEEGNRKTTLKEKGWMFSFGFGTRIITPALITARYVWGPQRGIRLGMEFDF